MQTYLNVTVSLTTMLWLHTKNYPPAMTTDNGLFTMVWGKLTLTSHKTQTVGDPVLTPCSLLMIKYTLPTLYPLAKAVRLLNLTAPTDRLGLPKLHGHKPKQTYIWWKKLQETGLPTIQHDENDRFYVPCHVNETPLLSWAAFSRRLSRLVISHKKKDRLTDRFTEQEPCVVSG